MNKQESDLNVHFIANAGVKDIVGRGLIYNDNVAIIELVKNSKDADSPISEIHFNNLSVDNQTLNYLKTCIQTDYDLSEEEIDELDINEILQINEVIPEIILKDYGKGMTRQELKNKWLNIAYSEKKLKNDKTYAGNKGVGRFSCDRLGQSLALYTKSRNDEYLKLVIDWTLFEDKGEKDEISSIPLKIEVLSKIEFEQETHTKDFSSGTILKIFGLRSDWNNRKHKKLISELEKFSPSLDNGFQIYFHSKNKKYKDSQWVEEVNEQKVDNGILEKLSFKTIYIKSSIDEFGEIINTTLFYQGEEIYNYRAKNPYKHLENISIEAHYMDSISRSFFTKKIGLRSNDYGSMFLFYNGFRVSPYGNEKNDWLNLDQRKAQGTSRYLGTRDIIGQININDNNGKFQVITSREGLAHNKAFFDLAAADPLEKTILKNGSEEYGYAIAIIRQLETFVVEGLDWNRLIDKSGLKPIVTSADLEKNSSRFIAKELSKEKVTQTINKIVNKSFIVEDFTINTSLISNVKKINQQKVDSYLTDFYKTVGDSNFADLPRKEKTAVKKVIKTLQHERDIARQEQEVAEELAEEATKEKIIATSKLKLEEERSSFLEDLVDPKKTLDALITHVVKQISGGIEKDIRSILSAYYESSDSVTKEELVEVLEHAVVDISTIKETANMATKASFNLKVSSIKEDFYKFIQDYIAKVVSNDSRWGIDITFNNSKHYTLIKSFKPAEACVLLVNLLENARKANTKKFIIECNENSMSFIDDGDGFDFERLTASEYMKKGITTTVQGSGLGLYHCQTIARSLQAVFKIENNRDKGAKISLEFK
jgi:signal transduction histidine kinase